ncbi:hypothetical protein EDD27_8411 [Nonomuraea polychroma]|uniref:Lipoprotein n=1 Tax=Nonomuraea polychroma TaxID=46176 RepID=A0A438MI73_9ACTN|nr:hypothetical protein [Nonomuraea polychroma]RVX45599.1 hypothetical protein EDD27_8411 [Nonomuraea polychroma]
MPNRPLFLAVLCLVGMAGCASTTQARPAPETTSGSPSDQPQRIQSAIADCMKQKGFKYVAWVPDPKIDDQWKKAVSGDYAAMRKQRQEEGFGVFFLLAHPDRKRAIWSETDSPNFAIKNELSPAQQAAYGKALTSCRTQAIKQINGRVVKSDEDWAEQENQMLKQTLDRELNGDPRLVELAAAMGDCLKGKGYRVDSVRPVDMSNRGWNEFEDKKKRIAMNDDIPEKGLPRGRYFEPRLAPAAARQYLAKEVQAALDDLECGKKFYAAYLPKNTEISERVVQQFGGGAF